MITLERVKKEIEDLREHGSMTSQNVHDLAALYWVKGKMECEEFGEKWKTTWTAVPTMSRETAQKWTHAMQNADGSQGEHWTYEQTTKVLRDKGLNCEAPEFYAAINMMWSDYSKVAEKFGVNTVDFWAAMAAAFLDDKDAKVGKLSRYYESIVSK